MSTSYTSLSLKHQNHITNCLSNNPSWKSNSHLKVSKTKPKVRFLIPPTPETSSCPIFSFSGNGPSVSQSLTYITWASCLISHLMSHIQSMPCFEFISQIHPFPATVLYSRTPSSPTWPAPKASEFISGFTSCSLLQPLHCFLHKARDDP